MPELGTPLSVEGLECATQRMTLLGVDSGSTVKPSVKRSPRVVINWSWTTWWSPFRVSAWIVPNSSETYSRPSGPIAIEVGKLIG